MAGNRPAQEHAASFDDPLLVGLVFLAVYAGVWASWHFGHTLLATLYTYWRYVEFYAFHALGEVGDIPGIKTVHDWIGTLCAPRSLAGSCSRDFSTVTWAEISRSSVYINIGFLFCLLGYCVRLFMRVNETHPKIKYAKAHDIKTFMDELKNATNAQSGKLLYPHLRLFSALNLIDAPLDDPLLGMSQTSKQFAFTHRLVLDWRAEDGNCWVPTLDRAKATTVFREQLGKHWTSSANLSAGETLLAAIAMPSVAATDPRLDDLAFKAARAATDDMIRYCWRQFEPMAANQKLTEGSARDPHAWLRPQIDLAPPRQVIARYIGHQPVQTILEHHAFNRTVIFALFLQARRLGVLQPAEMRWLRFSDRPIWYALTTSGRQGGFAEAAGVLSHYLYEAKAGVSIAEPQLDKAVSGLDAALNKFKFTDIDRGRYQEQHHNRAAM